MFLCRTSFLDKKLLNYKDVTNRIVENQVMPGVFILNRTSSCVVSQVKTETLVTTNSPDWSSFVSLSV